MTTSHSITRTYQTPDLTVEVPFRKDGFFNATAVAKAFNKVPKDWLKTDETKAYIESIRNILLLEQKQLVTVKNGAPETGGGTWLHPKLAVPFARWLDVAFAVWCDAQIDSILRGETPGLMPRVGDVRALLFAAKALNVAPSSQAQMITRYFDQFRTTQNLMPVYVIDAPLVAGVPGDSSEATAAATQLLKEHGCSYGARTFFELAENEGLVARLTRPSTIDPSKQREFWNITTKGLEFGKNITNPTNPRETQPHWYRSKFEDLLKQMGANC